MSAVALQDRALMDRSRAMNMAAAARDGENVKLRTKESIVQDFGDGIDSSCLLYESIIFGVFCGCSRVQNLQAPKGKLWRASKAFKLHAYHMDTMGALVPKHCISEGCVWKYEPMQVFPAGRR